MIKKLPNTFIIYQKRQKIKFYEYGQIDVTIDSWQQGSIWTHFWGDTFVCKIEYHSQKFILLPPPQIRPWLTNGGNVSWWPIFMYFRKTFSIVGMKKKEKIQLSERKNVRNWNHIKIITLRRLEQRKIGDSNPFNFKQLR